MKSEIIDLLSELLINDNTELPSRLRAEQQKLDQIKCIDREIGSWIDDYELPILMELLDAPDSYFYKYFPKAAPFSFAERQEFAEQIQKHVKVCEHCILKISYDTNWETQVDSAVELYRRALVEDQPTKTMQRGNVRSTGA